MEGIIPRLAAKKKGGRLGSRRRGSQQTNKNEEEAEAESSGSGKLSTTINGHLPNTHLLCSSEVRAREEEDCFTNKFGFLFLPGFERGNKGG